MATGQRKAMPDDLILILNTPAKSYRESGNVREFALEQWAKRQGADVWVVRGADFESSRVSRLLALPRVLVRLWKRPRAVVIVGYPGFPFFWSLDSVPQLARTLVFVAGFKLVGILRGQRIVVDIMDLPRYQHIDLHYPVGLPKWLFKLFDRCVYHLASELWICSLGIADCIKREMFWGRERAKTVENGAFPSEFDAVSDGIQERPKVFMYAGQLFETRGVPALIDEFCRCKRDDVELRLCGGGGSWIPGYTSDERVKYLGKLDEDECARAVAECDMGIVYQPEGRYYDMVFPTKLPLYLARGKPVIATDNPELSRYVNENQVGIVTPADGIAATIDSLTPEQVSTVEANAARMRQSMYWDSIYDKAYSALLHGEGDSA